MTTSSTQTLIFVYGTLKQGFPNHHLIQNLTTSNDVVFLGKYRTCKPYPLVCGPLGIPFLINLPGSGKRVRGELYSVSDRALAQLDELEGLSRGHYERIPVEVESEEVVAAEGYFGHRSFGVELWKRSGGEGLEEYEDRDGEMYIRVEDRDDVGLNLRDYVLLYLSGGEHGGST